MLGLGGGQLAKFLLDHLPPTTYLTCVELDPAIVEIARSHFDFPAHSSSTRLEVLAKDAMDYLKEVANDREKQRLDVIFLDLSTTDLQEGITCPPPEFTTKEAFSLMRQCLRPDGGVLTFNLVTRDEEIAARVRQVVKEVFTEDKGKIYSIKETEDELNEVLVCSKDRGGESEEWQSKIRAVVDNNSRDERIEWLTELTHDVQRMKLLV